MYFCKIISGGQVDKKQAGKRICLTYKEGNANLVTFCS